MTDVGPCKPSIQQGKVGADDIIVYVALNRPIVVPSQRTIIHTLQGTHIFLQSTCDATDIFKIPLIRHSSNVKAKNCGKDGTAVLSRQHRARNGQRCSLVGTAPLSYRSLLVRQRLVSTPLQYFFLCKLNLQSYLQAHCSRLNSPVEKGI